MLGNQDNRRDFIYFLAGKKINSYKLANSCNKFKKTTIKLYFTNHKKLILNSFAPK